MAYRKRRGSEVHYKREKDMPEHMRRKVPQETKNGAAEMERIREDVDDRERMRKKEEKLVDLQIEKTERENEKLAKGGETKKDKRARQAGETAGKNLSAWRKMQERWGEKRTAYDVGEPTKEEWFEKGDVATGALLRDYWKSDAKARLGVRGRKYKKKISSALKRKKNEEGGGVFIGGGDWSGAENIDLASAYDEEISPEITRGVLSETEAMALPHGGTTEIPESIKVAYGTAAGAVGSGISAIEDVGQYVGAKLEARDNESLLRRGANPELLEAYRAFQQRYELARDMNDPAAEADSKRMMTHYKRLITDDIRDYQLEVARGKRNIATSTLGRKRAESALSQYQEPIIPVDQGYIESMAEGTGEDVSLPSMRTAISPGVDLNVYKPRGVSPVVQVGRGSRALEGRASPYTGRHAGMKLSVDLDESRIGLLTGGTRVRGLSLGTPPQQRPLRYWRRTTEETYPGRQIVIHERIPPRPAPVPMRRPQTIARPNFGMLTGGGKVRLDIARTKFNAPIQKGLKGLGAGMFKPHVRVPDVLGKPKYVLKRTRPSGVARPNARITGSSRKFDFAVNVPNFKLATNGRKFGASGSTLLGASRVGGMKYPSARTKFAGDFGTGFAGIISGIRKGCCPQAHHHVSVAPFQDMKPRFNIALGKSMFSPEKIGIGKMGNGTKVKGINLKLDGILFKKKKKKKGGKK